MTALTLRRFRPEPGLVLRRFGPDGRLAALAERGAAPPMPALIGPPGAEGPQGPEGAPRRVDFQNAATWISDHALGRTPVVLVYLVTGERVLANVVATPINFTVTHAGPQSGFVLLI